MRTLLLLVLAVVVAATPARAEEPPADAPASTNTPTTRPGGGDIGLGGSLGWPTGFAGKWWYTDDQGVAFGVGLGGFSWIGANVDWQWTPMVLYQSADISVAPYFGFGAFAGLFPTIYTPFARLTTVVFALGVEVPLGVAVNVAEYPLDVFVELAPGLSVLPHIGVGTRAMAGARWYY